MDAIYLSSNCRKCLLRFLCLCIGVHPADKVAQALHVSPCGRRPRRNLFKRIISQPLDDDFPLLVALFR